MSTLTPAVDTEHTPEPTARSRRPSAAANAKKMLSSRIATVIAIILAILWTIPTLGLLITSFRKPIDINRSGWWTVFQNNDLTLDNYRTVLGSGTTSGLTSYVINSIVITIPAVLLPILLACLAAYAFAWMDFKGRDWLFVAVFALQVVPLQVALIPLLSLYVNQLNFANTYWSVC